MRHIISHNSVRVLSETFISDIVRHSRLINMNLDVVTYEMYAASVQLCQTLEIQTIINCQREGNYYCNNR